MVSSAPSEVLFANPFRIEDLQVLDCETLRSILALHRSDELCRQLARSLHGASYQLISHILPCLPEQERSHFQQEITGDFTHEEEEQARQHVLDAFFWELIYWKTPDLYEELTAGERLHSGIFQALRADLAGKTVLDAGAGSGRASFECRRSDAERVYAVEPSPGLLHLLRKKISASGEQEHIIPLSGRFDHLPLPDKSVDTVISCSAFTAADEQGGEPGLAEIRRVLRTGGKVIIIWPRTEDHDWFEQHGFHYVTLPVDGEMFVSFRSLDSALHCAQLFYAHNPAVYEYLLRSRKPEVPFSVIGINPPRDYFWLCPDQYS
jgi:ubiquinone/menaquinone biosynthesis C-methylase UbiE